VEDGTKLCTFSFSHDIQIFVRISIDHTSFPSVIHVFSMLFAVPDRSPELISPKV
jgi:hypothetical protein